MIQPTPIDESERGETAIVLFTLAPAAESRRKRLGRAARTADFFSALIDRTAAACSRITDADLWVAAPEGHFPIPGRHLRQRGRGFGESLRLAVEDAFELGYRRVIVIGNDAPEIDEAYLRSAIDALSDDGSRAVLGPARDGGYALLGLTRPCARAFDKLPWGRSNLARMTLDRLASSGFEVHTLDTLEDIDDPRSLQRFMKRMTATWRDGLTDLGQSLLALLAPENSPRPALVPAYSLGRAQMGGGLRAPPLRD